MLTEHDQHPSMTHSLNAFWIVLFEDSSPGPRYLVDSKTTRFGRDGTPSYSMLGRRKVRGESDALVC